MQTAVAPQAHTAAQPGLRGHSWNPDSDLLKRFIMERSMLGGGWSGVASFHTAEEAATESARRIMADTSGREFRIRDQFKR